MGALPVHVVPRARATAVAGTHGDAVKIRVAAPPVDGAANAELIRFVARQLNIPAARVTIASGAGGRRKRIGVEGMEPAEIRRRLLAGLAPPTS